MAKTKTVPDLQSEARLLEQLRRMTEARDHLQNELTELQNAHARAMAGWQHREHVWIEMIYGLANNAYFPGGHKYRPGG